MRLIAWMCVVLTACTATAPADVLRVPDDYATIQAAIDAAADGDEIELAAGTYAEQLSIIQKSIAIRSADPDDPTLIESVVLSFDSNPPMEVSIVGGAAAPRIEVRGLTIRHSEGSTYSGQGIIVEDTELIFDRVNFQHETQYTPSIRGERADIVLVDCRGSIEHDHVETAEINLGLIDSTVCVECCQFGDAALFFETPIGDPSSAEALDSVIKQVGIGFDSNPATHTMPAVLLDRCTLTAGIDAECRSVGGLTVRDCIFEVDPAEEDPAIRVHMTGAPLTVERLTVSAPIFVEVLAESDAVIRFADTGFTQMQNDRHPVFEIHDSRLELERVTMTGRQALGFTVQLIEAARSVVILVDTTFNFDGSLFFDPIQILEGSTLVANRVFVDRDASEVPRVSGRGPGGSISLVDCEGLSVDLNDGMGLFALRSSIEAIGKQSASSTSYISLDDCQVLSTCYVVNADFQARGTIFDATDPRALFGVDPIVFFIDVVGSIEHSVISGQTGVAGLSLSGASDVLVRDTVFVNNSGTSAGAVRAASSAVGRLERCVFNGNGGGADPAVAKASGDASLHFTSCIMSGNEMYLDVVSSGIRGVIASSSSVPSTIDLCTIWGNEYFGSAPINGNVLVTNSLIQDTGQPDPMFGRLPDPGDDGWYNWRNTPDIDEAANNDYGDLRLLPGSPAIDAGDSSLLPPDTFDLDADGDTSEPLPLDLDGNPRVTDDPATPDTGPVSPAVDLGAYEFQPAACVADLTGDGVLNFDDIDAFVIGFLAGDLIADLDANGVINLDDLDAFVASFLAGCG